MASSREYLDFVLDQLSSLDGISYKKMMGEFIIYLRGKIVGGIYDDMFLVKPVSSAMQLIPELRFVSPYPGAKEMLVVDNIDDRDFLTELVGTMYDELPVPVKH
ncbi:MAG: competence protein TfoX [Oscillospiraceae bacterium]|nr:competence protein TfoX [Oscillospiraceae bacterium]